MKLALPFLLLPFLLGGCGRRSDPVPPTDAPPVGAFRIDAGSDLADVIGVLDLKDEPPADGSEVVVLGRIRAQADGVLTIVDDEIVDYCGRGEDTMESCRTHWDYCCTPPARLKAASLVVELKDAEGKEVPVAASRLRLLDLVALAGTTSRDPSGALVVTTRGRWFVRERPDLPDHVEWPK